MQIAIDGPAGAGKSTIAKDLAAKLGLVYLDTGAMYRATALKAIRSGVSLTDETALAAMMDALKLDIRRENGVQHVYLDGEDVSTLIRTPEVSMGASAVSAVGVVRKKLVAMQQRMARGVDVVMDGRDIATKVLPDAEYKFFLTASAEVRAQRRCLEMEQKGEKVAYKDVLADIKKRDLQDSTRKESPLICAPDATMVDTGSMTQEEVVTCLMALMGR